METYIQWHLAWCEVSSLLFCTLPCFVYSTGDKIQSEFNPSHVLRIIKNAIGAKVEVEVAVVVLSIFTNAFSYIEKKMLAIFEHHCTAIEMYRWQNAPPLWTDWMSDREVNCSSVYSIYLVVASPFCQCSTVFTVFTVFTLFDDSVEY